MLKKKTTIENDDLKAIVESLLAAKMHTLPDLVSKSSFEASTSPTFVRRSILVIPQATLAGVLKGKSPQYHTQIDKEQSAALYANICDEFKKQLAALDAEARQFVCFINDNLV